ncbi:hypothetical protein D3C84_1312540 [compost metagenome]
MGAIAFGAGAVEGQCPGDIGGGAMALKNLLEQNNERVEIERLSVRTDGHFGRCGHLKLQFYF